MGSILHELDREWDELVTSSHTRRSLARWAATDPVFEGFDTLAEVVMARHDPRRRQAVQRALAILAAGGDDLAVRALVKALTPGLVSFAARIGFGDRDALDEVMVLAWERIRTYPLQRPGSVAANVVMDVRKHYCRHRELEAPRSIGLDREVVDRDPSVEDEVLGRLLLGWLADAQRHGVVDAEVLGVILRTRLGDETLTDVAAGHGTDLRQLYHQRWRAEARLRRLSLAA